jgi:formate dehydrogenase subunit gamma
MRSARPARRRPWCLALALCCALALLAASSDGGAQQPSPPPATEVPGVTGTRGAAALSEVWRDVRRGLAGTVTIPDREAGVLIQSEGEAWRNLRHGPLQTWGARLLLGVVAAAALYFALRGRIRIRGGRSGRKLERFALGQRIVHWFAAALFLVLGTTGLLLSFGRYLLPPLIGKPAYAAVASAAMQAHNLFGPLFVPTVAALCIAFLRGNGFRRHDAAWLLRGGGFFGGHPSSGRYNFGEKAWFWCAVLLGAVLALTGIVLDFPWAAPHRQALQTTNLLHTAAAFLFIAFGIGHVYLGTVGIEGALEAMTEGRVDLNWARQHHDLWAAEAAPPCGTATAGEGTS